MQEIFSNTTLTVNQLIEQIDTGALGLPELQRPFIWKDAKVRDLFDSMMRGYPIGYLMLWECPTLDKSIHIGVEAHSYASPKEVIIDGQQRLTSLYAVMKGKKVINSKFDEKSIIISYCPLQDKFEVGCQATKNDPEWIYNISNLFTTTNSFKFIGDFIRKLGDHRAAKGNALTDEEQGLIAERINSVFNLKSHPLPIFDIKANAEEEDVSEIFVRVNSGGVSLKQNDFILTLLSLYWDEGRREIERFSKESTTPCKGKTTSYNPLTTVSAQDVIRVVMAYAFDRARLKYGYKLLRGADFDRKGAVDENLRTTRFDILKERLPDVLDVHSWHEFIKAIMNAGYLSGEMILSGNAIFYTYALYLIAKHRFHASYNEDMHLTSLWFFYASLVSLYTGPFESTVEKHLNTIKGLKTLSEYKEFILSRINERLTNDFFDITLVGSEGLAVSGRGNNAWNAYVASLNIMNAKILFSKSNLFVSKLFEPGTDGNRKSLEKHHLFPKAYLKSLNCTDAKINQMANYALIDWKDNMDILDDAPSVYYPIICAGMSDEQIRVMEEENALPHGWENMSYDDFLIERRKLMAAKIKMTTGMDVMPHLSCRDKNRIAIRSGLLGSYASGIRNYLFVTGDPVAREDREFTKSVFDFNSIRLMKFAQSMNQEVFKDDTIFYGGALNQNGASPENIAGRMLKKMEAGCRYFLTQPVYDKEGIERLTFLKERTGAKILIGIMPLVSRRNALFIKNEMPGIHVPDEVVAKYKEGASREEFEEAAIEISKQIIEMGKGIGAGFYFMTPFNRVSLVKSILEYV